MRTPAQNLLSVRAVSRQEQQGIKVFCMMHPWKTAAILAASWREQMYGEIKKFRADLGVGVIRAEDGRAYRFEGSAIRNRFDNLEGQEVHFQLGELKARDIIVLAGSPWSAFGSISV
jgi:cold shock CspA family protein